MKGIIEIEVNTPHNSNALFAPLERTIRGRFDVLRAAEHEKNWHSSGFNTIPAQRIGIDLERGEGFILEPLHAVEHSVTAERIGKLGMKLAPARESFTLSESERKEWLWSLKRLVDSGIGTVVKGEFPKEVSPPAPKPGQLDPIDRLCSMIETLIGTLIPKVAA
ncbi:MAG: hypothetical protein AB7O62_24375 [Pirellulales bacterium]